MKAVGSSSVFVAVARHFANPRAQEDLRLTVPSTDADGGPLSLTPNDAREALYGPNRDPELDAAIWQEAVLAAATEPGTSDRHRLLLIWLAAPRLSSTATRICGRLRVDRADVESEMVLALLTGLRTADPGALPLIGELIRIARSSAWRYARAGLKETPSAFLENHGDDSRLLPHNEPEPPEQQRGMEVELSRPDGPDGLRTPLRFTLPVDRLGKEVLRHLTGGAVRRGGQHQVRSPRPAPVATAPVHLPGRSR
ncbi:hypothetical protein [Kitasatospora sp. NPDC018619]|uniref:hypothetical protein n=1 Tax=unclassified Kitasatospora TaxID=2633591 RepID=UPI00378AB0D3